MGLFFAQNYKTKELISGANPSGNSSEHELGKCFQCFCKIGLPMYLPMVQQDQFFRRVTLGITLYLQISWIQHCF